MKHLINALSLLFTLSALALARDAAALKADLVSMLPAGKTEIRMAWIKGGSFTNGVGSSAVVNKVSSADGVITKLYGPGNYGPPSVAANGQRVFFRNVNSGRLCVINWDGSGFREVEVGGNMYEYWCNPADGSDWVLVNKNGMSRVKVDAPSTSVQICSGDYGDDGCGLTDDGKWFFGFRYDHDPAVFSMASATAPFTWTYGTHGGCVGSLSGGAAPKYNHNPSGHTQLCIHDAMNQTQFTMYKTSAATQTMLQSIGQSLPGCESGPGYGITQEGTRFTQNANLLTYCSAMSKVNPILVRIPDLKMIYIEDGLSCTWCGDADAAFLPYGATAVSRKPLTSSALAHKTGASMETFSLDGRRLDRGSRIANSRHQTAVRGVVIRRNNGTAIGVRALAD